MKSNTISIDNRGNGFADAVVETRKVAEYQGLTGKESTRLQLITEEVLSLARSITGEMEASFWIESTGKNFELHLGTKTVMDSEKRSLLLSAASSRKNDAARTFVGYLRDVFERAMVPEVDQSANEIPYELLKDMPNHVIEDAEWDGYEKSVLRRLADDVRIAIRGGSVDMTVTKNFAP